MYLPWSEFNFFFPKRSKISEEQESYTELPTSIVLSKDMPVCASFLGDRYET